jgi:hypothetical protein
MHDECTQDEAIKSIQREQKETNDLVARLVAATERQAEESAEHRREMREVFIRFENILLADVEHRKDIEHLKKDVDLLGGKVRNQQASLADITIWRTECSAADIPAKTSKMWERHLMDQGLRRFVPSALAFISVAVAVYVAFFGG